MTKQNFDVNNLRVAAPCSVGWETMSGDARARYCHLCKLNVYNISEMTAAEVQALIAKSENGICGRLYKRADGTILTKDCPVGLRAYQKRAARLAGAALAAILGLFSVTYGQQESEKSIDASKAKITRTINGKNILTVKITDLGGAVIPDAEITILKSDGSGEKLKVKSDEEGFYKLSFSATGIYSLEVKHPTFQPYRIAEIEINNNEEINLDVTLVAENVLMGVVEVLPNRVEVDYPALLNLPINTRKPEKPPR